MTDRIEKLAPAFLPGEAAAVEQVLAAGERWGYGNLIHRLQTAWAQKCVDSGLSRDAADQAAGLVCVWCKVDRRTGKTAAGAAEERTRRTEGEA